MESKDTPTETLKQEKEWLIDAEKGLIYFDVSKDTEAGWWHKIKTKVVDITKDDITIQE